jgi:F-type H+-transporting ATPase subunit epsilon
MSATFHLTIAKVGENLFDGDAVAVTLPGSEGVLQILAGHEPLVAELRSGAAQVRMLDGATCTFDLATGVVETFENQVTVLL